MTDSTIALAAMTAGCGPVCLPIGYMIEADRASAARAPDGWLPLDGRSIDPSAQPRLADLFGARLPTAPGRLVFAGA
jgi:hypothetical protein